MSGYQIIRQSLLDTTVDTNTGDITYTTPQIFPDTGKTLLLVRGATASGTGVPVGRAAVVDHSDPTSPTIGGWQTLTSLGRSGMTVVDGTDIRIDGTDEICVLSYDRGPTSTWTGATLYYEILHVDWVNNLVSTVATGTISPPAGANYLNFVPHAASPAGTRLLALTQFQDATSHPGERGVALYQFASDYSSCSLLNTVWGLGHPTDTGVNELHANGSSLFHHRGMDVEGLHVTSGPAVVYDGHSTLPGTYSSTAPTAGRYAHRDGTVTFLDLTADHGAANGLGTYSTATNPLGARPVWAGRAVRDVVFAYLSTGNKAVTFDAETLAMRAESGSEPYSPLSEGFAMNLATAPASAPTMLAANLHGFESDFPLMHVHVRVFAEVDLTPGRPGLRKRQRADGHGTAAPRRRQNPTRVTTLRRGPGAAP